MIVFRQKDFAKTTLDPIRLKRLATTKLARFRRKATYEGNKIALNPGKATSSAVGYAVENPIAAAGNTASVVGPIVNPALLAVPVGSGSIVAEGIAKKIPIYKKITRRLSEGYKKSGLPKIIEPAVNAGVNSAKIMSGAY